MPEKPTDISNKPDTKKADSPKEKQKKSTKDTGVTTLTAQKTRRTPYTMDCDGGDCACPNPEEGIVEQQQVKPKTSSNRSIRVIVNF